MDVTEVRTYAIDTLVRGKAVAKAERVEKVLAHVEGSRVFGPKNNFKRAEVELTAIRPLLYSRQLSPKDYKRIGQMKDKASASIKEGVAFVRAAHLTA